MVLFLFCFLGALLFLSIRRKLGENAKYCVFGLTQQEYYLLQSCVGKAEGGLIRSPVL